MKIIQDFLVENINNKIMNLILIMELFEEKIYGAVRKFKGKKSLLALDSSIFLLK
jgi:hypothetical protein